MNISDRCLSIAPSATLAIDAAAKALKAQGMPVIGFGAGEPDFDTPEHIREAAKAAIDAGFTRYTPADGTAELKKAICEKLLRDNGLTYEPSQIVVSNGAKHSLYNTFYALLNPGDEVLIPAPCWVSYPEQVRMAGGEPVFVMADSANDFKPTMAQWEAAYTPRCKALILNSPSNPNGCVFSREELTALADFAVKHDLIVVSDEIYEYLVYDGTEHISIASLNPEIFARTVVVNGVSKAYAMTGWRIGYTASSKELAKAMGNFQSHATSNPNSIAQAASTAALCGSMDGIASMRDEFDRRRRRLVELIRSVPGLDCPEPLGAFYVMMDVSGILGRSYEGKTIETPMDLANLLLEKELVAVVPGEAFMSKTSCRLSYATSMKNIEEGMARIASFAQKLQVADARAFGERSVAGAGV